MKWDLCALKALEAVDVRRYDDGGESYEMWCMRGDRKDMAKQVRAGGRRIRDDLAHGKSMEGAAYTAGWVLAAVEDDENMLSVLLEELNKTSSITVAP